MADKSNRIKYAYLNYNEIEERLKIGQIDTYDVVFTKDTHEQYLINEDSTLLNITSRVPRFDSVESAIKLLNNSSDTYKGQIVAVFDDNSDVYYGYIVNKVNGKYNITSLSDSKDYNSLTNRPVINKTGTLADPVIVGDLDDGLYSVSGEYKIFDEYPTVFSSSVNHLFLVEKSNTALYVKDVFAKETIIYTLANGKVTTSKIVTEQYLTDNRYITETDFDAKLAALDYLGKAEAETYIKQITNEYVYENISDIVDTKINDKIANLEADDDEIESLFT